MRRVLGQIRRGERLPANLSTLEAMAKLAEAGLVQVERNAMGDPVRWVESDAGKAVPL
jgi:hypothetical protein